MAADEAFYATAERRIEWLALAIGAAGTITAGIFWSRHQAVGLAAGAAISLINFRWLKQGVDALVKVSAGQSGAQRVRVPRSVYLKMLGRYSLLAAAAYAILRGFQLPVAGLVAGLFSVVAAVLLELIWQLIRSGAADSARL